MSDQWRILGPGVDPDVLNAILEAVESEGDSVAGAEWSWASSRLMPTLPRVTHPMAEITPPWRMTSPVGLVGAGVDIGPAFLHVSIKQVAGWGVSDDEVMRAMTDNLRAVAAKPDALRVERDIMGGSAIMAVQGHGWGSALILTPDVLAPVLGPEPKLVIVPVRNILLAVPETPEEQAKLLFAAHVLGDGEHDLLAVPMLRWTGTAMTVHPLESGGHDNA